MRKSFASIAVLCLLMLSSAKTFAQLQEDDNRIANQFIVMLKPAHSIESLLQQYTALKNKECLSPRMNIYLLERNTGSSPDEFLLSLQRNENVKLAQFNHRNIKERSLIPNDPDFAQQWNMLNTGQQGGIAGADIDATEAWAINHSNVTACGDTVVVAIIDGMFDLNHEDLNYFTNRNEIPGNSIDDDGNGYIDDVNGWNIFNNNGDVNSTSLLYAKHSTHCAGIAGAIGNNGKGVAGVCWGAKILPVYGSSSSESDVVKAYDYVRTMRLIYNNTFGTKGAYVVATNSSFGVDNGNPSFFPIWCVMYDSMGYVGILSAAATVNSNINVDTDHDMPTECPSNWLITVTNTWPTDNKEYGAGYGKTSIDLGAPGHNIRSTVPPSNYDIMSGTSMASPHVAGTIAAMYAAACKSLCNKYYEQPDSIALLIKKYILDAAEWNSSLNNITVTNGRLNLYRAITNLNRFNCDSCNFSVALNTTQLTCKNSNDGEATLTFSTGTSADYNIIWSNSDSAAALQNLMPGFYVATVTDTLTGCARVATAEIHNPDTITFISINTQASVGGNPGNIIVNAKAGNEPLQYSLDGITYQSTSTLSVPANGSYTVYVKNTSGCVVQQTVVVSDVEQLQTTNYELRIFPNPANDALTIYSLQFENKKTLLEVFDITGRKIFEATPVNANYQLSTANFASGVYFVKVNGGTKKFAIAH
jgi:hypothetical protein